VVDVVTVSALFDSAAGAAAWSDCAVHAPRLRLGGGLLLAPAVLSFLALSVFELRRFLTLRRGGWVNLQSVVRGTGAGFYSAPMPGRLHLTPDGVWWVAEGSDSPVAVRGQIMDVPGDGEVFDEMMSLSGMSLAARQPPQKVPGPLWWGTLDRPATLRVLLEAGGFADVTVRGESMCHVWDAINEPDMHPTPAPPAIVARAPFVRFTLIIVGLCLSLAGFGVAALEAASSCGQWTDDVSPGGLWFLGLMGLIPLVMGVLLIPRRAALVQAHRETLNHTAPAGNDASDSEQEPAGFPQPGDTFVDLRDAAQPDGPAWTYLTIRAILTDRCTQEEWAADEPEDPRNWRSARRMFGARRMNHARAAVNNQARIPARYLLVRNWAGQDQLIVFPPYGDTVPTGVIDMMRPVLGAIPLEGPIALAGPQDPRNRQPIVDSWVVPTLDSAPLWPGWTLNLPDDQALAELVTGSDGDQEPEPDQEDQATRAAQLPHA
jgi:hypothetical protein